jgi:hypothetical protein
MANGKKKIAMLKQFRKEDFKCECNEIMEKLHFNDAVYLENFHLGVLIIANLVFNYSVSIIQILTGIVWICKG